MARSIPTRNPGVRPQYSRSQLQKSTTPEVIDLGNSPGEQEPHERMDIDTEGAFKISDPVPKMLSQICMTHRRLENLLTTFTT